MRHQSPNRAPFTNMGGIAGVNNFTVCSNLEKLEASTHPPTLVVQNSSPLRKSGGNPFRQQPPMANLQASDHSTRLVVRESATSGGARVSHSPLR